MDGARRDVPDLVEAFVGGFELTQARHVAIDEDRARGVENELRVVVDKIDADEAERGFAAFDGAEPRNLDHLIARRMFVNRALFADRRIGFVDRFAESNAELDRLADARFSGLKVARLDAEGAVNFAPEIEENRAAL